MATASRGQSVRARRLAPTAPTVTAPTAPTAPTVTTVSARQVGWLSAHPWETSIGSGVWPLRPRVTSNVITPRSSALLKRTTLGVVLGSPFVAADYAQHIPHGSHSSASVWMALTLHGSGSLDMALFPGGVPGRRSALNWKQIWEQRVSG